MRHMLIAVAVALLVGCAMDRGDKRVAVVINRLDLPGRSGYIGTASVVIFPRREVTVRNDWGTANGIWHLPEVGWDTLKVGDTVRLPYAIDEYAGYERAIL